jgi:succinate dehydrogenase / fumarate reductase cytochrome b subunit
MSQRERPLSPFLHYRWQYTNTLSILHRITGVLLGVGFLLLVYWLAAIAGGPESYLRAADRFGSPLGTMVLVGTLLSFCYHLLNGVRHLFFDLGYGFDKDRARASARAVVIGTVLLGIGFWLVLRHGLGGGT